MRDDPTRRNVMATGASDAEDWPEFAEWLRLVLYLTTEWDKPDDEQEDTEASLEAIYPLEHAMETHQVVTDRQLAMLVAIAVWHEQNHFDMEDFSLATGRWFEPLVQALARRAAVVLPEVPFIFPVEG